MSNIVFILLALVVLGIIIMLHEFGHYLVGRLMGIGIVEFSVGMGPKLFGWERKGIRYSLRCLPLGGYCSFLGEDEKNDDPRAMNNQPVWKRFLTVFAGPAFNFVLAVIIATGMIAGGYILNPYEVQAKPIIYSVEQGLPAEAAGFQSGDIITNVNAEAISFDEAGMERVRALILNCAPGESMDFIIQREGEALSLTLNPVFVESENRIMIGVSFAQVYAAYDETILTAIPEAFKLTGETVVATVDFLKDLVTGLFRGEKVQEGSVQGVVGVVSTLSSDMKLGFSDAFSSGINTILYWVMVISMNLGIMNLLPLPALDGGRLVFLAIEGIRRKPIDRNREGMIHLIGFGLLLVLMVIITYSDIKALFH